MALYLKLICTIADALKLHVYFQNQNFIPEVICFEITFFEKLLLFSNAHSLSYGPHSIEVTEKNQHNRHKLDLIIFLNKMQNLQMSM